MAEREVCLWETEAGERGAVQAVPGEGASDEAASEAGGVMMAHLVIDALRQQVATLEEDETRGMTDERYDLLSDLRQHIQHQWGADADKIESWYEVVAAIRARG